jgi:hypothetical protein
MKHGEDNLQIAAANFLRYQYPQLLWWHTPNGGKRKYSEAIRFKKAGVRAGVPDILLFWEDQKGAIELKYGSNGLQDTQRDFRNRWVSLGGYYAICRSLDEVQTILKEWGVTKIVKPIICPTMTLDGVSRQYVKPRQKAKIEP